MLSTCNVYGALPPPTGRRVSFSSAFIQGINSFILLIPKWKLHIFYTLLLHITPRPEIHKQPQTGEVRRPEQCLTQGPFGSKTVSLRIELLSPPYLA